MSGTISLEECLSRVRWTQDAAEIAADHLSRRGVDMMEPLTGVTANYNHVFRLPNQTVLKISNSSMEADEFGGGYPDIRAVIQQNYPNASSEDREALYRVCKEMMIQPTEKLVLLDNREVDRYYFSMELMPEIMPAQYGSEVFPPCIADIMHTEPFEQKNTGYLEIDWNDPQAQRKLEAFPNHTYITLDGRDVIAYQVPGMEYAIPLVFSFDACLIGEERSVHAIAQHFDQLQQMYPEGIQKAFLPPQRIPCAVEVGGWEAAGSDKLTQLDYALDEQARSNTRIQGSQISANDIRRAIGALESAERS